MVLKRRKSIRLQDYDYSQAGAYYITICTKDRVCLFGDVIDGGMALNKYGNIVNNIWLNVPKRYKNVHLDEFIIMPNHFHGIIMIDRDVGAVHEPPLRGNVSKIRRNMLVPKIIGYFKMNCAKQINIKRGICGGLWQRNYYERIIRDEFELNDKRYYIQTNPLQWDRDENNPEVR